MNPLLESKLNELNNASDYECWYLVKQPTAFDNICYLVSFLEDFKAQDSPGNLQDYIANKIESLKAIKPGVDISNNYRALRVAAFFGLIRMTNTKYDNAVITDSFKEVTQRCNGEYEKTELYLDIIQRQIEKMYISSSIDEEYERVRQEYRLYPVMLLYKVLIELGRSTGSYSISMAEYRYLVATTKTFEGFLDTLLLIKLLRDDPDAANSFEQYRSKFDNRLIQALKQLSSLIVERDTISLNKDYIEDVAHKVYIFEDNPNVFTTENYLGFLGSTKSLFELEEFEDEEELTVYDDATRVKGGVNTLLYGVPGSGKSWTIEKEYCDDESRMERLVFHPDYTYSDFIGQILPNVADGIVSYKFTEGPFTSLLKKAYTHPDKMFFLVIEEINRGNAPAIFGEVFQLLDRDDDGTSEYGITNVDIANIVYGNPNKKVRIPSNMSIIGTMNTSDQNVFTLDTAFQRRWNMRMIENTFEGHDYATTTILDTDVTWQRFCEVINNEIVTKNIRMTSSEDKRLGAYFVRAADLEYYETADNLELSEKERIEAKLLNYRFAEKVLKYLWDDAFKFSREDIFKNTIYKSLEEVVNHFNSRSSAKAVGNDRFDVFKEEVIDAFLTQDVSNKNVE
ncbi:MAG: McrB family protein [Eubacteriales bacterium]